MHANHLIFIILFKASISNVTGTISNIETSLIKKYSNSSSDYLTVGQLQQLLNKLYQNIKYENNSKFTEEQFYDYELSTFNDRDLSTQRCLSADSIFKILGVFRKEFNSSTLKSACPLILHQVESGACQSVSESDHQSFEHKQKPSTGQVWGFGILFVTIISLCSLFGVSVLPFMEKRFFKQLLTALIGLAVGSLSGSSIFHLMPQAFGLIGTNNFYKYLNISLMIWGGIWVFFMTERTLKLITYIRQKHRHNLSSAQSSLTDTVSFASNPMEPLSKHLQDYGGSQHPVSSEFLGLKSPVDYRHEIIQPACDSGKKLRNDTAHHRDLHFKQGKDSVISTVAWMVIFGDGLHNFIDGLSIGAAFNESLLTGISISVAVMCEELPHELGDFAVLLNAGMTMKQALCYNILSACTCYLGLVLGILLGEMDATTYIFGFAAGMFLYIALVDMVPEMNEIAEEASKYSVKDACYILLIQNLGIGLGVTILYVLSRYQDSINFC